MTTSPLLLTFSPLYTHAISSKARFPKARYDRVREGIRPYEDEALIRVVNARKATLDELTVVHDPDYVDAFIHGTLDMKMIRRIGFRPWTEHFVERALTIAGGSLIAFEALMQGAPFAGQLAGGTHHAFADRGEGYCVFNDIAICAQLALRDHDIRSILVIDLDAHQGNGTAAMFADEERVFTLSMHGARNYPFIKETSDLDIGLDDGTSDDEFLATLERHLPTLFHDRQPELVIYQAGVDTLAEDRLGRLALTREGLQRRNRMVFDLIDLWDVPATLVIMGGGYSEPIDHSVAAHVDVFAETAHRHRARLNKTAA